MAELKQLWLLAGGNGAGKTTFYRQRLAPLGIPFVNADMIAQQLFPDTAENRSYEAAKLAALVRQDLLREGRSFCFETVFSHPSKIDFVGRAKALGYQIVLVFIHLDPPSLNKARVAQRVEEGGHNVPDDKIEARLPRLLAHIKVAIPLCDEAYLIDNSSAENPLALVVTIKGGAVTLLRSPTPLWVQAIL